MKNKRTESVPRDRKASGTTTAHNSVHSINRSI